MKHYDRVMTKQLTTLINAFPGKLRAVHLCTGPGRSVVGLLFPILKQLCGREVRLRGRLHAGVGSDVLRRFTDYGLGEKHVQAVYGPHSEKVSSARDWILEQKKREMSYSPQAVDSPRD
jgi:hypothetical protein